MLKLVFSYCFYTFGITFCAGLLSGGAMAQESNIARPQKLNLDGKRTAQRFDGIGAVFSYEKLFYDYSDQQRNEILDYLFLPNYGAALQILKVEIGYDGNNTASSWPSHRRSLNEKPDFNRGFVWWLMKEARKRNPHIILTALHWGYPAYASTSELKAEFIYEFVKGAEAVHNLSIDYIGGNQNESAISPAVTKALRRKLDQGGFNNVKIIAADEGARVKKFSVLDSLGSDPEYRKAVDVIGVHYKGRPASFMAPFGHAYEFGKPIWSSEDGGGSHLQHEGGYHWMEQLAKLFIDLRFTAAIRWQATVSAYANMPWPLNGIIDTRQPWSGYYKPGAGVWSFAHLTQFSKPGWKFLQIGNSYLANEDKENCARIMGLKDTVSGDYSLIINTFNKAFPLEGIDLEIYPENGLKLTDLQVWRSDFSRPEQWFLKQNSLKIKDGIYQVHLDKGCLYTISTTSGQLKGQAKGKTKSVFPLPYTDNFENYKTGQMPKYFVDANSTFEIAEAAGGRKGKVLRQVVSDAPQQWHYKSMPVSQPLSEIGDMAWKDYTVEADFLLEQSGKVFLGGRFDGKIESSGDYGLEGYWLSLADDGSWAMLRKDGAKNERDNADQGEFLTLASGKTTAPGISKWVSMSIQFKGDNISAFIAGKKVAEQTDKTYPNGNVAIACTNKTHENFFTDPVKYVNMQVDNLNIKVLN